MQFQVRIDSTHVLTVKGTETISEIKTEIAELVKLDVAEIHLYASGRPISDDSLVSNFKDTDLEVTVSLLGGKVHGSLARAGKVKGQTPKVEKQEKRKKKTGRAKKRMQYNKRFRGADRNHFGGAPGPNAQSKY